MTTPSNTPSDDLNPTLSLPCVVPQVSRALRGPFYSPFVRAWCPELEKHGIAQDQFMSFLDGLNECWTTHPLFFFFSISTLPVPNLLFFLIPPVAAVAYTFQALKLAIFPAALLTAVIRTTVYVKKSNKEIFHPAGLHLSLMTTKKMLRTIGYPDEKLGLPAFAELESEPQMLKSFSPSTTNLGDALSTGKTDAPWIRRSQALHGYASPLTFDVANSEMPERYFKRLSPRKVNKKLTNKKAILLRRLQRMNRKYGDNVARVEATQTEFDLDIAMLKEDLFQAALDSKEEQDLLDKILRKSERKDERIAKGMAKAEKVQTKYVRREEKIANKIRWIVITKWSDNSGQEQEDLDDEDEEDGKVISVRPPSNDA